MSQSSELADRAQGLIGSEILKISAEVRELQAAGRPICNLSVGDFAPQQFPIPELLSSKITAGLAGGETNYAPANGMLQLRKSVVNFYQRWLGITVPLEGVLIAGGGRPIIYGVYQTLVNPGDRVVYPVPSWNNQYYSAIAGAEAVEVPCGADTNFLPTAAMLEPHLRGATLLVLNSPSNPTGSLMERKELEDICDLILAENKRREAGKRPLFLMYDQMYWMLTFGGEEHVNPVTLRPAMQAYTIFVDGISKSFASTGLRVGWGVGPVHVMRAMADLIGHVGAVAPRAEQVATAVMLDSDDAMRSYQATLTAGLQERLVVLEAGMKVLQNEGLPVNVTSPRGTIYLSAQFALHGKRTPSGDTLGSNEAIRKYLLHTAGLAAIPFGAFGDSAEAGWFRLAAGAVSVEDINALIPRLRDAINALA